MLGTAKRLGQQGRLARPAATCDDQGAGVLAVEVRGDRRQLALPADEDPAPALGERAVGPALVVQGRVGRDPLGLCGTSLGGDGVLDLFEDRGRQRFAHVAGEILQVVGRRSPGVSGSHRAS